MDPQNANKVQEIAEKITQMFWDKAFKKYLKRYSLFMEVNIPIVASIINAELSKHEDTNRLDWVQHNVTGQGTFIGINSSKVFRIWNHNDIDSASCNIREAIDTVRNK